MKKYFDDLTVAEIEKLIKCKDDNGEWLCHRGCSLNFETRFCHRNAFFNKLYDYLDEKKLITTDDESGKTMVELESEDTE